MNTASISEGGGTAVYTATLSNVAAFDVTVTLSFSGTTTFPGDYTRSGTQIVIPAGSLSGAVSVTAVQDVFAESAETIVATIQSLTNASFGSASSATTSIANDDGAAAFTLVISPATIAENGGTLAATIQRNTDPSAALTVNVASSDTTEATVPSTVTFAAGQSSVTFNVTAVDDNIVDGTQSANVTVSLAGFTSSTATVNITDNDVAGFLFSQTTGILTGEASEFLTAPNALTAVVTVRLTSQPTSSLVFSLNSNDTTEGTVQPSSIVFSTSNWNQPQQISIFGVDDFIDDGDIAYTIVTGAAISSDPNYSGRNPVDLSVTNIDNDTAGVVITESSGSTNVTEGGVSDSYTARLASQPTANVTVNIGAGGQLTTSVTSLTFTPSNWNVNQTVTVSAVNDLVSEGLHSGALFHTVTSADPLFNSLSPLSVPVTITDNDAAALSVSIVPNSFSENGGTALGTVTRNTADLSRAIVVTLVSSDASELTVPVSVTIPAGASSATFTVTAVDDALLDGTQTATVTAFSNTTGGSLDASFGIGGLAAIPDYRQNVQPSFPEIVEQPDGKYVVAGRHLTLNNAWNVIRLNRNGTLDSTFGVGGIATTTFPSDIQPQGIALYPDGQILVLGRSLAGSSHGVARYTSSGVLNLQIDPSATTIFGQDIIVDNIGDGGFLVGGSNTAGTDFAVTRYRYDGTLDTTYGTAGTATLARPATSEAGWAMTQQLDGKVVVVGSSNGDFGAARFNRNGTADTGFNFSGLTAVNFGSFDSAQAVAMAPDGKIVLAGNVNGNWGITRLAANGALDTTFGVFGIVNQDFFGLSENANTVGVQADGRIVVGGGAFISGQGTNLALARYNVNGTLDTTFDLDGKLVLAAQPSVFEETRALAIQADGNIIALGGYQSEFFAFRVVAGQPFLQSGSAPVQVTDYETLSLSISPTTIAENGGVATGTIVRSNTDVSSPLVVTLTNGDASEISIPTTVTIPAGQQSVTFSITGVDESLVDGTQVVSIDATASGYVGTSSSVNVTDDETTRLIVAVNSGTISEAAGTAAASITVTRNSSTASALTVTLSSSDVTEAVLQSTVVIPAGQASVTVPVGAVDDFVVDGSVTVTISASADGHDTGTTSLVVTDNDSAGVIMTPVAGLETTESGGTATFSVVLTSQPTSDVTIPLASSDSSEGSLAISSLTFTPSNWNIAQVVTITGVDDLLDDGDVVFNVLSGAAISSDANYNGLDPSDVTATNLDDDLAQLSLTVSTASISEGAGVNAATATVSRNSETSQPLTVTLLVNDGSEASVPVSVVIPAGASSVSFDIAAIDDLIVDGTQTVTISAAAAGHVGATGSLSVTDDDVAGFTIIGGGVLVVDETGSTQTFGVVLNAAPVTNVVITVTSGDLTEAAVAPATLTFTPANWNVTQLVTLSGVDDFVDDEAQFSTITVSVEAAASDDSFDGVASSTVTASTFDDDTAGITFTPNTGLFIVEGSVTDSVAITLQSQPTADVTFALSNGTPDQVTFSTYSLTFTPSNWNVPQVVVITGIENQIAEGGFGVGITPEPAVSADPKYNGLQAGGASGSIIDDDFRHVIVEPVHEHISENGTSTTFSIVLNSEPTGIVSIPISSGDPTEGSVSISVLNFTPSNWNVPQLVTVTGVDDSIVDDNIRFDVITGVIGGTSDYAGIDPEDVSVLNLDNDVLTLSLTIAPTNIAENGGTATGMVTRNDGNLSLPLTVSLSSSDTTEVSAPTTVTIPAGQSSITFMVSGVDDALNDGAQPVAISATAGGYVGSNDSLTITDNDGPVISANTLTISEGGSVAFTSAQISTSDPEFGPTQLVYAASSISAGRFEMTNAPGVAITSFTQAQINAGAVRFVHNGSEAAPTFNLTVTAGTQTSPVSPAVINFTNVNDAPIVSGALSNVSVLQGAANQSISLSNVFSDIDNVSLTYSAVSSNGTLVGASATGSSLTLSFSATLTGVATVTVTGTDAGGLYASTSFTVTVSAVNAGPGVTLINGVLKIVATNGNDELQINKVGNQYQIVACFLNSTMIRYSVNQVQSIEIDMLAGNDHVNINNSVTIPVTVRGGDGNDDIKGGGGPDLIYGGAGNDDIDAGSGNDTVYADAGNDDVTGEDGNDTLYGGDGDDELEGDDGNDLLFGEAGSDELEGDDGNDILSGGSGNDELEGDAGFDFLVGGLGADLLKGDRDGDLLIGNRVTFENDPVALQFVLAEWTSNRSYSSRVANLRGNGSGTRLNGTTFLNASTVLNDNAIDTLMGSNGQDWFLGTIGQDLFSGRSANEQVN
ncbi:MAG: Calx-beta domain-containing protein [Planctomycetaceae bacterium]